MNMNINNQKLIYFYSPMGTWTRVNKNLEILGLDKTKKICNTYARNFANSVKKSDYLKKYKYFDVLYLDEFYSEEISDDTGSWKEVYNAMIELIKSGKQIVMAGHGNLESFYGMPEEMKEKIISYDLNYDINIDTNIRYI